MPFWFVLLIIGRELMVTSIRLVAVGTGKVIAASHLGKYKTAMSMLAFTYYFFLMPIEDLSIQIAGVALMLGVLFLTLLSGIDYLLKNRSLLSENK
jgi:CDP-diacylglycerol--glycerol-3-phosphate 3-phosphatidyltransferase